MASASNYKLPAIDPNEVERHPGTFYPAEVKGPSEARIKQRLGDAAGLHHFGVNLTTLPPGASSALRHWHQNEDEFIYVLEGELTLHSDAGEQILTTGMAAGFPAGNPDAHCYVNKSDKPAVVLEVGNRVSDDEVTYPFDDLHLVKRPGTRQYHNKSGEPLGEIITESPRPVEPK